MVSIIDVIHRLNHENGGELTEMECAVLIPLPGLKTWNILGMQTCRPPVSSNL